MKPAELGGTISAAGLLAWSSVDSLLREAARLRNFRASARAATDLFSVCSSYVISDMSCKLHSWRL